MCIRYVDMRQISFFFYYIRLFQVLPEKTTVRTRHGVAPNVMPVPVFNWYGRAFPSFKADRLRPYNPGGRSVEEKINTGHDQSYVCNDPQGATY